MSLRRPLLLLGIAGSLLAACATSAGPTTRPTAQETRVPLPAGRFPSRISKMVCAPEAQREIAGTLGVTAVVETPTWVAHRYSCRYTYPDGAFTLSVQELSSWAQTYAYFAMLGTTLGDTGTISNLGQGAFTTSDGSVVVRKDWKVLLVDISGLPARFGVPPTTSGDVAQTVADVILGCWAGD